MKRFAWEATLIGALLGGVCMLSGCEDSSMYHEVPITPSECR